jgi:C-terminal processing protease CtpA/Prc
MSQLGSIGCVLSEERDGLVVRRIIQGGSAHFSGRMAVGDTILQIDNVPTRTLQSIFLLLSSRPTGSLLTLLLRRKEDQQSEQVIIISQESPWHRMENDDAPCGISAALNVIREGVRVDQVISDLSVHDFLCFNRIEARCRS